MLCTPPVSSATVWFCELGQHENIKYFSVEVPYMVKQRPIKDIRLMEYKMIGVGIHNNEAEYSSSLRSNAVVAVDGVVYVIVGGDLRSYPRDIPKPYIQRLDAATGEITCFHKIDRYSSLQVADLDGKIYIFGKDYESCKPSFEVFDTVKETFEMVPEGFSDDLRLLGVDCDLKRIVFITNIDLIPDHDYYSKPEECDFFFYDTVSMTWDREQHRRPDSETDHVYLRSLLLQSSKDQRCVVAAKRIYWLTHMKQIMAYDFAECAYYESKILTKLQGTFDTSEEDLNIELAILLHMNENYFCLVSKYAYDGLLFITTLRVSSSTTNKRLTVSLLNTYEYFVNGMYLDLRHALRLRLTDPLSMPNTSDTEQDLEELVESPSPPPEPEDPDPDPIIKYVSNGDGFISDVPLSIWIYGYVDESQVCCFPIELSKSEESREAKRRRVVDDSWLRDDRGSKIIKPIFIDTSGILDSAHVAVDDIIYNIGGSYENPWIWEPCINCFDIKTMKIVTTDKPYKMTKGRMNPQVVELDRKIYIFGGDDEFVSGSFKAKVSSEVFDTDKGCCTELPDGFECSYKLVGIDRFHNRIVFLPNKDMWLEDCLGLKPDYCPIYFYNTVTEEWYTETETKLQLFYVRKIGYFNHVIVGTTLYWFSDYGFLSYDFDKHEFSACHCKQYIEGFPPIWNLDPIYMFHMYEDLFCLVIQDESKCKGVLWIVVRVFRSGEEVEMVNMTVCYILNVQVLHVDLCFIDDALDFERIGALRVVSTNTHKTPHIEEGSEDAKQQQQLHVYVRNNLT